MLTELHDMQKGLEFRIALAHIQHSIPIIRSLPPTGLGEIQLNLVVGVVSAMSLPKPSLLSSVESLFISHREKYSRGAGIDALYENGNDNITSDFPTGIHQYWPGPLIQQVVRRSVVCHELDKSGERYDQDLVFYILRDAKKLFAISIILDSDPKWTLNVMKFFKANDFKDHEMSAEVGAQTQYLVKERLFELDSSLWSRGRVHRICEFQWKVLVPVVSTEKFIHNFAENAILPFSKIGAVSSHGAFSMVIQVKIQEGHFEDPSRPVSSDP